MTNIHLHRFQSGYTRAALLAIALLTAITIRVDTAYAAEGAIARLNYAGFRTRSHCTATLIGPSKVLTAKHCIDGKPFRDLRVVFGYDRGNWAELRNVKSVHPDKTRDLAILCLAKSSQQSPVKLGDIEALSKVTSASVTGYQRSRPHLATTLQCSLQKGKTKARMECPVEPGMSGSPVRVGGKIVAVMASTAKAYSIAVLAKDLPQPDC